MNAETNLTVLLKSMEPVLNEGEYVFCSLPIGFEIPAEEIISSIRETEALSVVIHKDRADALKLTYQLVHSWITLSVHSSLEAIGLTATFSKALTDAHISCNVIAGYYHDHIFVSKQEAANAMRVLKSLTQ
jgi:hypothetical protein